MDGESKILEAKREATGSPVSKAFKLTPAGEKVVQLEAQLDVAVKALQRIAFKLAGSEEVGAAFDAEEALDALHALGFMEIAR